MWSLLFRFQKQRLERYFAEHRTARLLTALLFVLTLGGVAVGVYLFFVRGFAHLQVLVENPGLENVIALFIYEFFFLIISFLVFFSALITGIFSFFRPYTDRFLLASPRYGMLPYHALYKVSLVSLWPVLVLGLPAVLGVNAVFGLGLGKVLVALLSIFLLVISIVVATAVLLFVAGRLLMGMKRSWVRRGLPLLVLATGLYLAVHTYWFLRTFNIRVLLGTESVSETAVMIDSILSHFRWFISDLTASGLHALQTEGVSLALAKIGQLGVITIIGLVLFHIMAQLWFLPLCQAYQEGSEKPRRRASFAWVKVLPASVRLFIHKEMITLFRDPKSLLWFGFLGGLWLVQVGASVFLAWNMERYGIDAERIMTGNLVLNFVTTVLFVSGFALRFAFPAFSLEGRTAWILAASPLDLRQIFHFKLGFFTVLFVLMGFVSNAINMAILGIPFEKEGLTMVVLFMCIWVITAAGLSLGALFPNFKTNDPQLLSTSLPGLCFTIGSIAYGAAGAGAVYVFLENGQSLPAIGFVIASVIVRMICVRSAEHRLPRTEFI